MQLANADTGMMIINFRNKLHNCNTSDAGNYLLPIVYRPPDFSNPSLIRKSLKNYRRESKPTTPLLSSFGYLGSYTVVSSNWSSFDKGVSFDDCFTNLHIPLYNVNNNLDAKTYGMCCIFRPSDSKIAIMVIGNPKVINIIEQSEMVGEEINIVQ